MDGQQSIMLSFHLTVILASRASSLLSCHLSGMMESFHESFPSVFHGETRPKHCLGEMSDNIHFAFSSQSVS
jgi:hypothetical protein